MQRAHLKLTGEYGQAVYVLADAIIALAVVEDPNHPEVHGEVYLLSGPKLRVQETPEHLLGLDTEERKESDVIIAQG